MAPASLATDSAVLVVSESEAFRLRSLRQFGHEQGGIVAVSSWTRIVPHLGPGPVAVLSDVRTVTRHRDHVLHALAGRDVLLIVVGSPAPLPRWLRAINAVGVGAREVPSTLAQVHGG